MSYHIYNHEHLCTQKHGEIDLETFIIRADRKMGLISERVRRNLNDATKIGKQVCDFSTAVIWDQVLEEIKKFNPNSPASPWIVCYYKMAIWALYDHSLVQKITDKNGSYICVCRVCLKTIGKEDTIRSHFRDGRCILTLPTSNDEADP